MRKVNFFSSFILYTAECFPLKYVEGNYERGLKQEYIIYACIKNVYMRKDLLRCVAIQFTFLN